MSVGVESGYIEGRVGGVGLTVVVGRGIANGI